MKMRAAAAISVALTLGAASTTAQSYPVKPLRMIVPAGPGGGVDTIARFVGTPLAAALGQPVVMENRPGAGTMVASELTAKSAPDGYTLLMVSATQTTVETLSPNKPYQLMRDFTAGHISSPEAAELMQASGMKAVKLEQMSQIVNTLSRDMARRAELALTMRY